MAREAPGQDVSPVTVDAWLNRATRQLGVAGIDTPRLDARRLLENVSGLSAAAIIAQGKFELSEIIQSELTRHLRRRLSHEPVSRICGVREFYGRPFRITPATLDPRPDSETIIEAALEQVRRENWGDKDISIIDVGTGSGCLLLTLLAELPQACGLGTDISQDALDVARENAASLGVAGRVRFQRTDMLKEVNETFDLLISNPPYIPSGQIAALSPEVSKFDPHLALDGGVDGLDFYHRLGSKFYSIIPDGWMFLEVGFDQARAVADLLHCANSAVGPENGLILRDLGGNERVVALRSRSCGN